MCVSLVSLCVGGSGGFRGGARGRAPLLFGQNLTFFNVKLRPKSVNLKI